MRRGQASHGAGLPALDNVQRQTANDETSGDGRSVAVSIRYSCLEDHKNRAGSNEDSTDDNLLGDSFLEDDKRQNDCQHQDVYKRQV